MVKLESLRLRSSWPSGRGSSVVALGGSSRHTCMCAAPCARGLVASVPSAAFDSRRFVLGACASSDPSRSLPQRPLTEPPVHGVRSPRGALRSCWPLVVALDASGGGRVRGVSRAGEVVEGLAAPPRGVGQMVLLAGDVAVAASWSEVVLVRPLRCCVGSCGSWRAVTPRPRRSHRHGSYGSFAPHASARPSP